MIYITIISPPYKLKQKKYNIEYKLGPFNVFSEEKFTSQLCEAYYSTRETTPMITVTDMPPHDCYDTQYYLTFKPTLLNTSIDFDYIRFYDFQEELDEEELEQRLKLEREIGRSGMEFSDDIQELGYIIRTEEVTCSDSYSTFSDYKSLVHILNIASFVIILGFIFLAIFMYKKRYKKLK